MQTENRCFDDVLIKKIFNERIDLIPIVRNPFTNSLLSSYVRQNSNTLPPNQAELYYDYIFNRLHNCKEKIDEHSLSIEYIIKYSTEMAYLMFDSVDYGLEIPTSDLRSHFKDVKILEIVEVLNYARLGRIGQGVSKKFSFVHRRFNEYFVSKNLLQNPNLVPKNSIPEDSRWRDALVLFCEVAPLQTAIEIAEFCWKELKIIENKEIDIFASNLPQYLRSMHCLRFLCDAYKGRKECLVNFHKKLHKLIYNKVEAKSKHYNLLDIKLAVEATGLLNDTEVEDIISLSFTHNSDWISETAINSCRHIPSLSKSLRENIEQYFDNIPDVHFFIRRIELLSPLKFSISLDGLYRLSNIRLIAIVLFFLGLIPLLFFYPSHFLIITIMLGFQNFIFFEQNEINTIKSINYFLVFLLAVSIIPTTKEFEIGETLFYGLNMVFVKILLFALFIPKIIYTIKSFFKYKIKEVVTHLSLLPFTFILGCIDLFIFSIINKKEIINNKFVKTQKEFIVFLINEIKSFFYNIFVIYNRLNKVGKLLFFLFIVFNIIGFSVNVKVVIVGWSVILFFYIVDLLYRAYMDYLLFSRIKKMQTSMPWNRSLIEKHFYNFNFSSFRLRYIQYIANENIPVTGYWSKGKIPMRNRDKASTLIAKLEEKWLGLQ